jgi:hypothetical protein
MSGLGRRQRHVLEAARHGLAFARPTGRGRHIVHIYATPRDPGVAYPGEVLDSLLERDLVELLDTGRPMSRDVILTTAGQMALVK